MCSLFGTRLAYFGCTNHFFEKLVLYERKQLFKETIMLKNIIKVITLLLVLCIKQLNAQTGYHQIPSWLYYEQLLPAPNGKTTALVQDTAGTKMNFAKFNANLSVQFAVQCSGTTNAGSTEISNCAQGGHYLGGTGKYQNVSAPWIARFDDNGTLLWQKYYRDSVSGSPVTQTRVCNSTSADKSLLFAALNYNTTVLTKIDSNGTIIWQKFLSSSALSNTGVRGIVQLGNNYILSLSGLANRNGLAKIDANGVVVASEAFEYSTDSTAIAGKICHLPASGNYAMLINNNSTLAKTKSVAFLDSNLKIISVVKLSTTLDQYAIQDIAASEDGSNLLVFGDLYQPGTGVYADFHLSIAKLSPTGMLWHTEAQSVNLWNTSYSTLGAQTGFERGGLIYYGTAGSMDNACIGTTDNLGSGYCFPVSKNLTSSLRFPSQLTTTTSMTPFQLLAAVPATETVVTTTPNMNTLCGAVPTSVESTSLYNSGLVISPNPAHEYLQFSNTTAALEHIKVYNINGALVLDRLILNNRLQITSLNAGVYFYEATDVNEHVYRGKFLVQ
ncbi:MAG: Secretion system C-terminal sorting domain [Bacteroidota bacterium]|jgi:hypothetical protein